MPEVAVVCVNYGSSADLQRLLASLSGEPVSEIVVWDNRTDDRERERLRAVVAAHTNARAVFSGTNVGFGAGVNGAVATLEGTATHVWILNPDVVVVEGALDTLLQSAAAHATDLISPLVLTGDSSTIWYAGGDLIRRAGRSVHRNIGADIRAAPSEHTEVTFVTGAAVLVSRAAWDALGGFDERFFLYCEDADLSDRAARAGLRMGIEPAAVVRHHEGATSGGTSSSRSATFYYYVQRNRLVFYSAWSSRLNLLLGKGSIETLRLLVHPFRPVDRGAPRRFTASLAGIVDGLQGTTGQRRRSNR